MSKRRYLTGKEVQAMMQAVCYGATGARDYCLILLAYRHGMRISELLDLHYQDPVSYTHLDVYKRQVLSSPRLSVEIRMSLGA